MANILKYTSTNKPIFDSFSENEKQNFTPLEHKEAYNAMNEEREKADKQYKSGDTLSLDDRRYFGVEARKHFEHLEKGVTKEECSHPSFMIKYIGGAEMCGRCGKIWG